MGPVGGLYAVGLQIQVGGGREGKPYHRHTSS